MACNLNEDRTFDKDGIQSGAFSLDGGDSQKQSSDSTTTTSKQNGDQAGCEDEQMSEQDASERRRSGLSDAKNSGSSPSTPHRSAEELPRRIFQIPRKIKERKGLLQQLAPDSREFEELMKLLSSFYLDASSRGAFTYTKACLIHNELLEKEFIEKKRELKQTGRTDMELTDSYAFLLPDANKSNWICEKGLTVGHARLSNLGNASKGVYLSKYSDLLQINPFEAGASGDIIIFKVMKGRLKSIFENMPKNNLEPSPKFDCHVHKNGNKVTSLLSYRAFELTQHYFYEFAFEELRSRPRQVCPYAVVSFQYKGKESATSAHRLSSAVYEGHKVRRRYTVWSGPLVNRGEELYQVCIRSPALPFLPLKLPDKIDISMAMHLNQVKRKIPSTLLSWDTYGATQEALKCGMYCSLFEVMGKTKQGNCLSGLLHKLEKEKMVLVKPLVDRGFLFLISPSHMHSSSERRGRNDRGLQALFVFQEPRITARFMSRLSDLHKDTLVSLEPQDSVVQHLDSFVPALHHAFFQLRPNAPADLANGVRSQALDYLSLREQGKGRAITVPEYRQNERPGLHPVTRPKGMDLALSAYMYGLASHYNLPIAHLQPEPVEYGQGRASPPGAVEDYSPVSDWSGSGQQASSSGKAAAAQSNGSAPRSQASQAEYDKDKMEKLLKLIQMHKRTLGKEDPGGQERGEDWDHVALKRRMDSDGPSNASKYLKTGHLSNGEPARVPQGDKSLPLLAMRESLGLCDTDLREQVTHTASLNDTRALIKLFLSALNRMAQASPASTAATAAATAAAGPPLAPQLKDSQGAERVSEPAEPTPHCDRDLRTRRVEDDQATQDYLEDQMECSISSMDLCSPSSSIEPQTSRPADASSQNRLQWRATSSDSAPEVARPGQPTKTLDSVFDEEIQTLRTGIRELMDSRQIYYVSQHPQPRNEPWLNGLTSALSPYVSNYVAPPPMQGYISTLWEKMNQLIHPPAAPAKPSVPTQAATPAPNANSVATPAASSLPAAAPPPPPPPAAVTSPPASAIPAAPVHSKTSTPKQKSNEPCHKSAPVTPKPAPAPAPTSTPSPTSGLAPKNQTSPSQKSRLGTVKEVHMATVAKKSDAKPSDVTDSPKGLPSVGSAGLPGVPEMPPDPNLGSNVISQIKPDVLCTLMEIMQMNAVKFYIQRGEEEENELCTEIKRYLESLGNIECDPQMYLQNNCQQKFMVIIQNEDIASHVHKIPALVSLKKLSTVYFAGVDSLDDVKNRTYNELFVSGGLIVSDELTLNPDFITLEKLQAFLQFLEGQSTSWAWKIHCKTQKKLKELSRLNSEALDLLNLLTAYQKKHLVEFLPYHECDVPSRQAPDLDCLVKLQAQHTQLRHIVFLTDKCSEVPKFSGNGIITASINDILTNFEALISSTKAEVPVLPVLSTPALPSVESDACVDEEDMSLDSDEDAPETAGASVQANDAAEIKTPPHPPPQADDFRPLLPDPLAHAQDPLSSSSSSSSSFPVDYSALKSAISQYKASRQVGTPVPVSAPAPAPEAEESLASFGVNPHQSYLQWSPYSGSPGYHVSSAYSSPACSASQGQDFSQAGAGLGQIGTPAAPLSQPAPNLPPPNPNVPPPTNPTSLPPSNHPPLRLPQASSGAVEPPSLGVALAPPCPLIAPPPQPPASNSGAAVATAPSTGLSQPLLPGSQDTLSQAMESAPLPFTSSASSSSLSSASSSSLPGFPDPPSMFSVLTPIPPLPPPMFNWAPTHGPTAPPAFPPPGVNITPPFRPPPPGPCEAVETLPPPVDRSWVGPGERLTPNNQSEVCAPCPPSAPPSTPFREAGPEKSNVPGVLVLSGIQGSRTPVNSCGDSLAGAGGGPGPTQIGPPLPPPPPGRGGGTAPRGLLPIPGSVMGPGCRGHPQGMGSHKGGGAYNPRGGMQGPMDMMRGGFRGRPPMPMRSRPGRGPMMGSSVCNWGFPPGRGGGGGPDYYSDYTYP